MDYGKFKYESDMKAREARRNQANTVLKEIRFRLKIDPHDYGTKKGHVERFLAAGDKVKVMIMFRGREQSRPEMGIRLLQRLAEDVAELGFVESAPKQDGRNMIMVLGPVKKKAEAKSEQRKRAQEAEPRQTKSAAKAAAVKVAAEPADGGDEPLEAPVAETAQIVESPAPVEEAPAPAAAPVVEEKPAPAPKAAAPKAAPRAAAPKAPAPKAAAPAAPAATPKPAAAPKPVAVPKPAATPKPPAPRPAAPKPGAAKPKPGGKTS
jgi:translation initiation factor IF-3